jgi:cystathionine gamma-synthase
MPQQTLLNHPLCHAEDLGKRIPDTPHAISMCLPRWQDVIGYEERAPATMETLQTGYPRFLYHPLVQQVFDRFKPEPEINVQIYSTQKAAQRCKSYIQRKCSEARVELRTVSAGPCVLVAYPSECADHAMDYWQHAGEGISSRCAEALLQEAERPDASEATRVIVERIAEFSGAQTEDIYLFPSGMAAIHAALLVLYELTPERPTAQFAFPYGDTLKLQEKMGAQKPIFHGRGDDSDLRDLEGQLASTPISGLLCEFPTNPLLTCVNITKLRALADQHGFPLIIDDTLGACINLDLLPQADVIAVSLTKFFSGTSDVMGGALILNPNSSFTDQFREQLEPLHEADAFYPADIIRLEKDSRCYRERVEQINRIALEVCEYLHEHPAVDSVYYPALEGKEHYDHFRRPEGGYGGLFSFVLKEASKYTEAFYDALEITKGPNLGTSFSLCCPFTLLAHYNELEWAEAAGASRWLIRISAGLEPAEELIRRIDRALASALHG